MKQRLRRTGRWLLADRYRLVLLALALIYCVVFTRMAWDFHLGMRTHRSDLGQIDQAVWNSSHGRWLEQTDNGFVATRLTDHVEPILVLISPIFWLWNDVRALLLLQVVAAAIGVFPLYALARHQFEKYLNPRERSQIWRREPVQQLTRPLAFVLGVAYLLAPQLQSALLTEFHAAPLAVPLILWAFWSVDARRWRQFAAAAVLTALVKEEMALLAAGLGLWAIWRAWWDARLSVQAPDSGGEPAVGDLGSRTGRRSGIVCGVGVLLFGLAWFGLATFVIVPAYAQPLYGTTESTYFQRYGQLGDSSADILKSFVTQPDVVWAIASEPPRVAYLLGLLAAFAWFALLAPEILLLSLPLLLANLLSAYPAQYYGEFHYSAPLVPYFAVAAAYGLGRLWRWLARHTEGSSASFQHLPAASGTAMAAAALVQNPSTALRPLISIALILWTSIWSGSYYLHYGRGPLGGRYDPTPVTAHHRLLDRFTVQIPADAPVTATAGVHPHVSHRRYVYQFPLGLDAPVPAEWALIDVTTNTDMAPGDLKTQIDAMLADDWGVVDAADGFLLLRKGAQQKTIPHEFTSFARVEPDEMSGKGNEPANTDGLQLAAVAAQDWPRWRQTKLVADWRVGKAFDPAKDEPWLQVTAAGGETLATLATAAPPALVWYPPQDWQPGETVRITTLPMALPRAFAVTAAGENGYQPLVFMRQEDDRLVQMTDRPAGPASLGDWAAAVLGPLRSSQIVTAKLPGGESLSLRGWLAAKPLPYGLPLDVWLQWTLPSGATKWPEGLAAFVHWRRAGANVAQADGAPTWFGGPALVADDGSIGDWRQLPATTPDGTPIGGCNEGDECQLVVGIYDPQSGQRLPLLAADGTQLGDEFVMGTVEVAAPAPDQACALVGACD